MTHSDGTIKYQSPDKGLFKVEKVLHYMPPAKPGGRPKYESRKDEHGEYWICDGKATYEFDYKNKHLKVRPLPPEMQGTGIADGPLPFLFGAKAEKIKQRYWVRVLQAPPGKENKEFWLLAVPKTRQDAANFKQVEVILDAKLFLPLAIQVYDRGFDGRANFSREVYVFDERVVNEKMTIQKLNIFRKEFFQPTVPLGWKKVVVKRRQPTPLQRTASSAAGPRNRNPRSPGYSPR